MTSAASPLLPPLAGEDHVCGECGFSYPELRTDDVAALLRRDTAQLRDLIAALGPGTAARRVPDVAGWSVAEYLCHLRDVYVVHTIRLHRARWEDRPALEPMYNDLRAARFRYGQADPAIVIQDLANGMAGFLAEVDEAPTDGWDRVVTRIGEERTARWLVRNVAHESRHHLRDVAQLVAATAD
ncbi:MAG: DinB family protein [Pseudonocardiales bacterium]|nr:DinB family protein [Pseudonocardiales bacterium]